MLEVGRGVLIALLLCVASPYAKAQTPPTKPEPTGLPQFPPGFKFPPRTPNDTLVSPEVSADGRVTFRIYAPDAKKVQVKGEFLDFADPPVELKPTNDGVWSATSAPINSGAYRYTFAVDGATVLDNRNPNTSSTPTNVQSLLEVSNSTEDIQRDRPNIPHGAIATVYYPSSLSGGQRRLHVYLPPDYNKGKDFPVLYLLHGGGDGDDSWPTVGRAGFIMDNLIASGKAKSMVVVFPNGSVRGMQPMVSDPDKDPFTADLMSSIIPFVQENFKVSADPNMRALAGLSMGGIQTLNIGLTHTGDFRYLGVFSSGWFPPDRQAFDAKYGSGLKQETARLKLFWWGYGDTDIARQNAEQVLKMLTADGVKYQSEMTPGGHSWTNWRLYLSQFAPLLFR